jgi:hypothetical protein
VEQSGHRGLLLSSIYAMRLGVFILVFRMVDD